MIYLIKGTSITFTKEGKEQEKTWDYGYSESYETAILKIAELNEKIENLNTTDVDEIMLIDKNVIYGNNWHYFISEIEEIKP